VNFGLTVNSGGAKVTSYEIVIRDQDDVVDLSNENPLIDLPAEVFNFTGTTPPATQEVTFTKPGHYEVLLNVTTDAGGSSLTSVTAGPRATRGRILVNFTVTQ
jgi:hypothetical protein